MSEHLTREDFSNLLDDALTAAEKSRLENHLRGCADCQQVFADLKKTVSWMKTVPAPQPRAGLETRLAARLKPERPFFLRPVFGGLMAGALAVLVVVFVRENEAPLPGRPMSAPAELAAPEPAADLLVERKIIDRATFKKSVSAGAPAAKSEEKDLAKEKMTMRQGLEKSSLRRSEISVQESEALQSASVNTPAARGMVVEDVDAGQVEVVRSPEQFDEQKSHALPPLKQPDYAGQMLVAIPLNYQITSQEFRETSRGRTLILKLQKTPPVTGAVAGFSSDGGKSNRWTLVPRFDGPIRFEKEK